MNTFEKWVWIELIGFDNTLEDYGVKAYIENAGFVPKHISFLLTGLDILHEHAGMEIEKELPRECCSYSGRESSIERHIQKWTNKQLKGLIDVLHSYDIKAFPAFFTYFGYEEMFGRKEWTSDHKEILEMSRTGESLPIIGPLKRFKDDTYYEDFFFEKLAEFVVDYGFDGWHAADGWGPCRLPVYYSDYSNDMIGQFLSYEKVDFPSDLVTIEETSENVEKRANFIWENYQLEWTEFYMSRWEAFHKKGASILKPLGKKIYINSAWTRDPIEAMYRYGMDYRRIIEAGVDGIIIEAVASASDMLFGGKSRFYTFSNSVMFIRNFVPDAKLVFLHGIKDITEQWDVLRHMPTMLEREIISLINQYYITEDGKIKRNADGLMCCLGDSVFASEWEWLRNRWELAEKSMPEAIDGTVLVGSATLFRNSAKELAKSNKIHAHRLFSALCENKANIIASIDVNNLKNYKGDILVLQKDLFSAEEIDMINSYKGGRVIEIGYKDDTLELTCGDINFKDVSAESILNSSVPFSMYYVHELELQEISENFLTKCAEVINSNNNYFSITLLNQLHEVIEKDKVVCTYQKMDENTIRVFLKNEDFMYGLQKITPKIKFKSVEVITSFPIVDIDLTKESFNIVVPGKGCVVFDIKI